MSWPSNPLSPSYVDYQNISKVIEPGRIIFIDDGALALEVLEIVDEKTLRVRTRNGGILSSRKGVNLPNTVVDLPALSEKDKEDLRFGVEQKVDMIFASFIRGAGDIHQIRDALGEEGKHIHIIAKIENRQGLNACEEIIAAADGVMVARGDLGIEIPHGEVILFSIYKARGCLDVGADIQSLGFCCTEENHQPMQYSWEACHLCHTDA